MRSITLIVTCLACLCSGRRLETPKSAHADPLAQSFAQVTQLKNGMGTQGPRNRMKSLAAVLLVSANPAFGWGMGGHSSNIAKTAAGTNDIEVTAAVTAGADTDIEDFEVTAQNGGEFSKTVQVNEALQVLGPKMKETVDALFATAAKLADIGNEAEGAMQQEALALRKQLYAGALAVASALGPASTAHAIELDEATRTVAGDQKGTPIVLTVEQVKRGKRLFNQACATCHTGGITKTNPNVGLDAEALAFATPRRDNIAALVDYMNSPTTYDGIDDISEIHPAIKSADIFPKMRALTEEDLTAIAGHILSQPAVVSEKWGGGKIYY